MIAFHLSRTLSIALSLSRSLILCSNASMFSLSPNCIFILTELYIVFTQWLWLHFAAIYRVPHSFHHHFKLFKLANVIKYILSWQKLFELNTTDTSTSTDEIGKKKRHNGFVNSTVCITNNEFIVFTALLLVPVCVCSDSVSLVFDKIENKWNHWTDGINSLY